jgi:cobalt-zinc-cadmium efflux system membrane fusion protein
VRAQHSHSDKGKADPHGHGHGHEGHAHGAIKLSAAQIEAARIEIANAEAGTIARRLNVPGAVIMDADRVGRVAAKVVGTVAELRKRLGDEVSKGEVVAILESREVADAKSEYLGAVVAFDLQKTLFDREQMLWDRRIIPEQQFLRTQTALSQAKLRVDLARQKLSALDLSESEVADLPNKPIATLRQKEIRAPLGGRVVERKVDLGAPVGGEGHEKELYVIADLSSVWLELSVPTSDLALVREGQPVAITAGGDGNSPAGKIIFTSPVLDRETRSARVIAAMENKELAWRPGSYVGAQITLEEQPVDLCVPRAALQTIAGEQVVFVRTEEGFEKREVVLGKADERTVEIVFGLDPGEPIAVANTFILKAELGKSEADHGHAH